jgi:hypothetical protein
MRMTFFYQCTKIRIYANVGLIQLNESVIRKVVNNCGLYQLNFYGEKFFQLLNCIINLLLCIVFAERETHRRTVRTHIQSR